MPGAWVFFTQNFDFSGVSPVAGIAIGILKKIGPVKILANGDIKKGLRVIVDKVSESAREKIIAAGGTVEV